MLALSAAGRSNEEIAESLVLSVRTVERHLARVYDRLGLGGKSARGAAAAYATSLGLAARRSRSVRPALPNTTPRVRTGAVG